MNKFKLEDLIVVNKDRYYDPRLSQDYLDAYKKACEEKIVYEVVKFTSLGMIVKRMDNQENFLTGRTVAPIRFDLYKSKINWLQSIRDSIGK